MHTQKKMQTHKRKCKRAKEDLNAQGQIRARAGAIAVCRITKGELQMGNCKGERVLMTTDGNSQT